MKMSIAVVVMFGLVGLGACSKDSVVAVGGSEVPVVTTEPPEMTSEEAWAARLEMRRQIAAGEAIPAPMPRVLSDATEPVSDEEEEIVETLVPPPGEPELDPSPSPFERCSRDSAGYLVCPTTTVTVPLDVYPPVGSGSVERPPNTAGWHNVPVLVKWVFRDPPPSAGAAAAVSDTLVSTEGKDQIVRSEKSCDPAGNCADASVKVSIDTTPPLIDVSGNDGPFDLSDVVAVSCVASDALSGVSSQSCPAVNVAASSFGVGTKTYTANATDVAGNTTTKSFSVTVRPPVWPPVSAVSVGAVFATGTDGVVFSGSGHKATGTVHSESKVRVSGAGHSLVGGVEYVSSLTVSGAGSVIVPAGLKVIAGGVPVSVGVADYRPGGPAAGVLGASLQSVPLSKCVGGANGVWSPAAADLTDGVIYYIPCGVTLAGAGLTKTVSLVAEGSIKVTGAGVSLTSAHPSTPALLSGNGAVGAVAVSSANVSVRGSIRTPGGITISGAGATVCSLLGSNVNINGENAKLSSCP
jgi:hypothetical protein